MLKPSEVSDRDTPTKGNAGPSNPFTSLSLFSSTTNFLNSADTGTRKRKLDAATEVVEQEDGNKDTCDDEATSDDKATRDDKVSLNCERTGEEDDEVLFKTECKLWKLVREGTDAISSTTGSSATGATGVGTAGAEASWRWQERGCGTLHINRNSKTNASRLVMRMRGVLKLLLNTPIFPTGKYEKMGENSVRFLGVDDDAGADVRLCSYRLNLRSSYQQGEFLAVLNEVLGTTTAEKTSS